MSLEIIYETHSLTTDNEAGIATGWLPGQLSDAGRRFARELGERRCNNGTSAIFGSDLARSVETVEVAFAGCDIPVHYDARLRECNYGMLNGMPVSRLALEKQSHIDAPYPGGESYRQVVVRTRDFLRDVAARWDGAAVLLVSHSANKRRSTTWSAVPILPSSCVRRSTGGRGGRT